MASTMWNDAASPRSGAWNHKQPEWNIQTDDSWKQGQIVENNYIQTQLLQLLL